MSYYWVQASPSDFSGTPPNPRSGHTAVSIGRSTVVFFGGFVDKKFLNDLVVYDTENKLWFHPKCTGNESNGQVGPSPRAFHIAVAIDCHMFVFGGRSGSRRLGDFWVLDTDIWQWTELSSFGDIPTPRDFAAASAIGNQKIVLFGGWDSKKWLSDVYILDTISLEWTELSITGSLPPPRCGHTATMLEKRLLSYGGRGGGGPVMGDLWALKGVTEGENESPGWTQLKLAGQQPSPRCGHTFTSGGHYLLLFGGHGTGGWLSRYDIYYNDCIVLDRVSAQWKRLAIANEPPPPRAYHSMTCMGSGFLLFGGFDGKFTYSDIWWLVSEGDPIVKHWKELSEPVSGNSILKDVNIDQFEAKDTEKEETAIEELGKRLGINVTVTNIIHKVVDTAQDKEFLDMALVLAAKPSLSEYNNSHIQLACRKLRDRWMELSPNSVLLKELGPLLRDYQRLIMHRHMRKNADLQFLECIISGKEVYRFYHVENVFQLHISDIPIILEEYKQLWAEESELMKWE